MWCDLMRERIGLKLVKRLMLCVMVVLVAMPQSAHAADRDKVFKSLQKNGVIGEVNHIDLKLSKVKKAHYYLVINDSHIIVQSPEITDKKTIDERIKSFSAKTGVESRENFRKLMSRADELKLDGIILNGDIVDEYTASNLKEAYTSIKGVKIPVIFLQSDHDTKSWWAKNADKKRAAAYAKRLGMTSALIEKSDSELILVGLNDSYKNIEAAPEKRLEKLFKAKKPVILFSHVPFVTKKPETFKAFVDAKRGKSIFWGKGGIYKANPYTKKLLGLLNKSSTSPAAVICGHIHYEYSGRLAGGAPEYICPPFFEGGVTLLTVR